MQQCEFLGRARKALIKHGIMGSRAKALLEEWNDHLQSEVEKLVAGGQDPESSYQDACKALGEPESLVDSAAKQLAMESWQGRNPVLSSGILSVVIFLLCGDPACWPALGGAVKRTSLLPRQPDVSGSPRKI